MPATRKHGNVQRRSFTTIFSNEQRYLSVTGLSRDIADAYLGTQSNVFEKCVVHSLMPSRAAERYAAMLFAQAEPLSVMECTEALARELSVAAGGLASDEHLEGLVRYVYDYAARHRVRIACGEERKVLIADLEAVIDRLPQMKAEDGPDAAYQLLALVYELSDDEDVPLRSVPYVILSAWDSLGDKRLAFRSLADAALAALAGNGLDIADEPSDRWGFIATVGKVGADVRETGISLGV